jgi:hypothetical protein
MKIKPHHFIILETEIKKILVSNPDIVSIYESGAFSKSDKTNDLQRRFCFDILYSTNLTSWVCNMLYTYLNDDNIYTALKKICPTITRKF